MFNIRCFFLFSLTVTYLSVVNVNAAPKPPAKLTPSAGVSPISSPPAKGTGLFRGGPAAKAGVPSFETSSSRGKPVVKSASPVKASVPAKPLSPQKLAAAPARVELPIKPPSNTCPCYVPAIYSPVCGSDKQIYANKYLLECENTCSNKKLKVLGEGKC